MKQSDSYGLMWTDVLRYLQYEPPGLDLARLALALGFVLFQSAEEFLGQTGRPMGDP